MFKVEFLNSKCKGCQLCVSICPKKIITLSKNLNTKGYYAATIEDENISKCIGCASCGKVCPDSVISIYKIKEESINE